MRRSILPFLVFLVSVVLALPAAASDHHVNATLSPVGGSGVSGRVELTALPGGGTRITVVAMGLTPGTEYLSLYYDNGTCEVEPYSADDVIGHYTAGPGGTATVTAKVDDDLDEIHSVSVRLAQDFSLQACAGVNP
ncbi:MAG: hypothetical protein ACM3JJ_11045 [Hyphomicrobiales bacterium]